MNRPDLPTTPALKPAGDLPHGKHIPTVSPPQNPSHELRSRLLKMITENERSRRSDSGSANAPR